MDLPDEVNEKELKMAVAALLFDQGFYSSGQAAGMVGISKKEFLKSVGKLGVSILGETFEDIKSSQWKLGI